MYYEGDEEEDDTMKKDMLLRHSRLLYPELEDWLLEMTVVMYLAQEKENNRLKMERWSVNDDY